MGDTHLVTVPQGVVGDCFPWGGEGQGEGGLLWYWSPTTISTHIGLEANLVNTAVGTSDNNDLVKYTNKRMHAT